MKLSDELSNQELCMLLDFILALLETNNTDKAIEVIKNGIRRIDKNPASISNTDNEKYT